MLFTVTGEITHSASNMPGSKIFYLQQLLFDDGRTELRLGYYIIGKKPGAAGKWVWGQFAPMMLAQDFRAIADEARRRMAAKDR